MCSEEMLIAGRMMQQAADSMRNVDLLSDQKLRQMQEMTDRFEAACQQFHDSVERLILDGPNPHGG